jgi:Protein of unknown function (DUF3102)
MDAATGSEYHVRACKLCTCWRRGAVVMSHISIHAGHVPAIAVNAATRGFDYRALPAETAQALQESRTRIRTEITKTAASVIAIGRELIAVKKALGHGAFGAWVQSECGFCLRSAQNYMGVAHRAGKNASVALLPLATLYRMGGRRTTRWMLNAAAERVAEGDEMTEAALERLYKMFLDSKARRVRRGGLDQNAVIRKSERRIAAPSAGADAADEGFKEPSAAELAEQRAQWILKRCGEEFSISLVAMQDSGGLAAAVRVLKAKLSAPKQKRGQ